MFATTPQIEIDGATAMNNTVKMEKAIRMISKRQLGGGPSNNKDLSVYVTDEGQEVKTNERILNSMLNIEMK